MSHGCNEARFRRKATLKRATTKLLACLRNGESSVT
jgi:hypothetical protein